MNEGVGPAAVRDLTLDDRAVMVEDVLVLAFLDNGVVPGDRVFVDLYVDFARPADHRRGLYEAVLFPQIHPVDDHEARLAR